MYDTRISDVIYVENQTADDVCLSRMGDYLPARFSLTDLLRTSTGAWDDSMAKCTAKGSDYP